MKTLIITAMLGDYSEVAKEIENSLRDAEKENNNAEDDEFVSIHAFAMLEQSYNAKFDECEKLKLENAKLTAEVSKYRYFIECQRNEIDKL